MLDFISYKNLYKLLSQEQKDELERTYAGSADNIVRSGIELYRTLDEPSLDERQKTEKFLKDIYTKVVGEEDVVTTTRGGREITAIAEPKSAVNQVIRDMTGFVNSFLLTEVVGRKVTKPIQGIKKISEGVKKLSKSFPRTTAIGGSVIKGAAQGEVAAQISLDPYEENLASFIGSMIDDSNEGLLGDFEEYFLDPLKPNENKTEIEARLGLLVDGLAAAGILVGGLKTGQSLIANRKKLVNAFKQVKEKGVESSNYFLNLIKRNKSIRESDKQRSVKFRQRQIAQGKSYDMGDIRGLDENFLGLKKFSQSKFIRTLANNLSKVFSSRGGRTKHIFEEELKMKNIQAKWDKTIEHTMLNLNKALETIQKATGSTKDELVDDLNTLLFSDFRVPGIITSKGVKEPVTQRAQFLKLLEKFPEEARQPIIAARDLQDKASKLLLDSNYISKADKKIIQDQLGFYVRRTYKAFEDPSYTPSIKVINEVEEFIRQDILSKRPRIKPSRLENEVKLQMDKLLDGKGKYAKLARSASEFKQNNRNLLKEKVNVPEPIRKFLGEITDPVEKLALSIGKVAKLSSSMDFYNKIYRDGQGIYIHNKPKAGFDVQIPKAKGTISIFGDLSGKYTSPELANYFQNYSSFIDLINNNKFFGTGYTALAYTKGFAQRAKTVWNQGTHFLNVFGQNHMSLSQGINVFDPKITVVTAKRLYKEFVNRSDLENQAYIQRMAELGILNKGPIARDLKALYQDVSNASVWNPFRYITDPIARNKYMQKISKGVEKVTDLYIAEDDFSKIVMFESELQNLKRFNSALSDNYNGFYKFADEAAMEVEAARLVRNGLPNYDIIPEFFLGMRRVPLVGQFFSFLAESTRIGFLTPFQAMKEIRVGNKLIKEGEKEAGTIMLQRGMRRGAAFSAFGAGGTTVTKSINQYLTGTDEQQINDFKRFAPDFYKLSDMMISYSDDGVPLLHDLSRYNSFDYPQKMVEFVIKSIANNISEDMTDEELKPLLFEYASEMLTPFFGEAIVASTLTDYFIRGGKDKDGRLMTNPYSKSSRFNEDIDSYIGKMLDGDNLSILVTNLVNDLEPGAVASVRRYIENYGEDETKFDQNIYEGKELLKLITGYGVMPMNEEYLSKTYDYKINQFARKRNNRISSIKRSMEMDTPEKIIAMFDKQQALYYEHYKDFYNLTKAGERIGIDTQAVLEENGSINENDRKLLFVSSKFNPIGYQTGDFIGELIINESFDNSLRKNKNLTNSERVDIEQKLERKISRLSQFPILDYDSEKTIDEILEDQEDERMQRTRGGLVEGTLDVPFTREDPADRIDPFTGEPYSEQMDRLGFSKGGNSVLIHPENKIYFEEFHNNVLETGRSGEDALGRPITMFIGGVQHEGKEYLVPRYDPNTKKILSSKDAKKKALNDILSGKLKGYESVEEAERDRSIFYPQIIGEK